MSRHLQRLESLLSELKACELLAHSPAGLSTDRFRIHAPRFAAAFAETAAILHRGGMACTPFDAPEQERPMSGLWVGCPHLFAVYVYADLERSSHFYLAAQLSYETEPKHTYSLPYRALRSGAFEQRLSALIERLLRAHIHFRQGPTQLHPQGSGGGTGDDQNAASSLIE